MIRRYQKDPDAVLDYRWDWREWLEDADSIASFSVEATGGLVVDSSSETGGQVLVWVRGGTVGQVGRVTVSIVTAQGRKEDRSILLEVNQR